MLQEIKEYVKKNITVSLQDLCIHFESDSSAMEPIMEKWVKKGIIQKIVPQKCAGCTKQCSITACSETKNILYKWVG